MGRRNKVCKVRGAPLKVPLLGVGCTTSLVSWRSCKVVSGSRVSSALGVPMQRGRSCLHFVCESCKRSKWSWLMVVYHPHGSLRVFSSWTFSKSAWTRIARFWGVGFGIIYHVLSCGAHVQVSVHLCRWIKAERIGSHKCSRCVVVSTTNFGSWHLPWGLQWRTCHPNVVLNPFELGPNRLNGVFWPGFRSWFTYK